MKRENDTKYAILGLITTGCNTGYAIKQKIDNSLNHFWKISYGQVYPMLNQLVKEGLANVTETPQTGKPNKKEYSLTQDGNYALVNWLQKPIKEIPTEKNELLLKVFFSRHQSNAVTVKHIDHYFIQLQKRLETYESIEKIILEHSLDHADSQFWLFTLDYGKKTTRAAMDWCQDTKKKLL
ncbi:PadR family transcriptional regulator [Ornithinibacillus sp. L9]|uniref:PadR family transcriptional regulator n=1 Tax=Ornithinibacillus caprae TaxID=2678566 RepID=A0A6N8FIE1_9BACI|nr:PadR family transcriptional regulator [Ornithinibacillus caprae]MUK89225.1 PadR family transcriptional regulator [Ornithinibacillus caprae]